MADRFVTVPDSLELPASVLVPIARLSDAGTAGRAVLDAETAADGRTALGLGGAAVLNVGTGAGDVKAGNYQPAAANISDSTAVGRALLTAADAAAQRTALGLGSGALATAGAPTARAEPPTRPTWLTTFQPGHGWTDTLFSGTLSADTDPGDFIMGAQSIRIVNSVAEKSGLALNLTGRHLVVRLRVNTFLEGHYVSVYAHSGTWANWMLWEIAGPSDVYHRWFQAGEWAYVTLPWEGGIPTGSPNRAAIDTIRIRPATQGDINVQAIGHAPTGAQTGRVSFTFDDGYDSWLTLAAPTLAKYGIAGTGYVIPDFDNGPGYLSAADCRVLQDLYGWDMEMHGDNDLTTLTAAQMREEWSRGKRWFRTNGLGNADHIAYPYGQTNADVVATAREFFTSGRTISAGKLLESWPPAMPLRVRAASGVSSAAGGVSVAQAKALIDKVVASGQWLVLVFHVIGATASTTMTCTTTDLDEIAAYAAASGAQIQTVADAMR